MKSGRVPDDILHNAHLNEVIRNTLPRNYNYEVHKSIWRIKKARASLVALQFPEGLLFHSVALANIISDFTGAEVVIMGDVTYGACCVDDYSARSLNCDFLIHYGHSCLVPIDQCEMEVLYVFVEIDIDVSHLVETLRQNFSPDQRIVLSGTVQFIAGISAAVQALQPWSEAGSGSLSVPQAKPLSKGEVLGCTAPHLEQSAQILVFVADGRFHLESVMIQNPHLEAFYKYDPYTKRLTTEKYGYDEMRHIRKGAIERARSGKVFGLILGTLGRQGSPGIMKRLEDLLNARNVPHFVVLLSEITPAKLSKWEESVDVWIQVACPRLSIDWGYLFPRPLLSPYEAFVLLEQTEWKESYPMDYYSREGGEWTNYHGKYKPGTKSASKDNRRALRERIRAARKMKKLPIELTD